MASVSGRQTDLVGKGSKMKRFEFTQKIQKFIDAPFALGDTSKGWDCLNSLAEFYDSIGAKFPREFGEWNEQNYADGWLRDPSKARMTLIKFLRTLGEPVDKNYLMEGDLLIICPKIDKKVLDQIDSNSVRDDILKTFPTMFDYVASIFDGKELLAFPAVYLGRGHLLIVFNKGVKVVPLKFFKNFIVEARRLAS